MKRLRKQYGVHKFFIFHSEISTNIKYKDYKIKKERNKLYNSKKSLSAFSYIYFYLILF